MFNTRKEQQKLDTAKAILRKCPPYMFKSNWINESKGIDSNSVQVVVAVVAIAFLAVWPF